MSSPKSFTHYTAPSCPSSFLRNALSVVKVPLFGFGKPDWRQKIQLFSGSSSVSSKLRNQAKAKSKNKFLIIYFAPKDKAVELNVKGTYDISWQNFCVKLSTSLIQISRSFRKGLWLVHSWKEVLSQTLPNA